MTDISFKTLVKQNPAANVEVTPGFAPVINGVKQGETGGFVFRNNEADLVDQFNQQLTKMHSDGEWLKIVEPFGFGQGNIPAPGSPPRSCAPLAERPPSMFANFGHFVSVLAAGLPPRWS